MASLSSQTTDIFTLEKFCFLSSHFCKCRHCSSHRSSLEERLAFFLPLSTLHPSPFVLTPFSIPPTRFPLCFAAEQQATAARHRARHSVSTLLSSPPNTFSLSVSPSIYLSLPSPPRRFGLRSECPAICVVEAALSRAPWK